ncbi:MAG: aminotransferase class IV [Deltaproteobacteria bacterium]|nr:aminotransferase class IV [Deltaproteobacteria bacterium]
MSDAVDRRIWIDGALVPWADATVHVLSHSLQRGSLIFDYMSVHETERGPAVFRMPEHLERFHRSAEMVGLDLLQDVAALGAAVAETVRANPGAKAVKISAYLASVEVDVVALDPRVSVAIAAYDPYRDVIAYKTEQPELHLEFRIWIEKERRNRRHDIVEPQAKVAANYVSPMVAKARARRQGYDDILLLDDQGHVAEGPTTNVFRVDEAGALITPPETRVLLGVTRRSVIELAKHDGRPVREETFGPEALFNSAEVFLTGTTANVLPVVDIDGCTIGGGSVGPVCAGLRDRFHQVTHGLDPAFAHWLSYAREL